MFCKNKYLCEYFTFLFQKGDIIDVLAKSSSGFWVGRLKNQVGHFKFINVEEIQNGERKTQQKRMSSFEQRFNTSSKTLEDLLEYLGLEVRNNCALSLELVMN